MINLLGKQNSVTGGLTERKSDGVISSHEILFIDLNATPLFWDLFVLQRLIIPFVLQDIVPQGPMLK